MQINNIIASVFIFLSLESHAMSGNDLMGFLKGERADEIVGLSYLDGITSSNFAYESISARDGFKPFFCMPNKATVKQTSAVVMKYMEAHAEKLHQDASVLVLTALSKAWPCR